MWMPILASFHHPVCIGLGCLPCSSQTQTLPGLVGRNGGPGSCHQVARTHAGPPGVGRTDPGSDPESRGNQRLGRGRLRQRAAWAALSLLAWLGVGWVVFLAVWPAAWSDPLGLTTLVILGSQWGMVTSHEFNYFLGQVTATPGPLFYLVAGSLRMTPLTLILCPSAQSCCW